MWGVGYIAAPVNVEITAAGEGPHADPDRVEHDEVEFGYWLDEAIRACARFFVTVDLPLLGSPLTRGRIQAEPALANIELLRQPQMGNPTWFTNDEWSALQKLLGESALEPADPADVAQWNRDAETQQPDADTRRVIEAIAVEEVRGSLESEGWQLKDVQSDNVGWDLTARRGDVIRRIEVKGRAPHAVIVHLTANEVRAAREQDETLSKRWLLLIIPGSCYRMGTHQSALITMRSTLSGGGGAINRDYAEARADVDGLARSGRYREAAEAAVIASRQASTAAEKAEAERLAAAYFGLANDPKMRSRYALAAVEDWLDAASREESDPEVARRYRWNALLAAISSRDVALQVERARDFLASFELDSGTPGSELVDRARELVRELPPITAGETRSVLTIGLADGILRSLDASTPNGQKLNRLSEAAKLYRTAGSDDGLRKVAAARAVLSRVEADSMRSGHIQLLVVVRGGDEAIFSCKLGGAVGHHMRDISAFSGRADDEKAHPDAAGSRWTRLDEQVFASSFILRVSHETLVQSALEAATDLARDRGLVRPDPDPSRATLGDGTTISISFGGPTRFWFGDPVTGDELPVTQSVEEAGLDNGDVIVLCATRYVGASYMLMSSPDPEWMFNTLQLAASGRDHDEPRLWGALLYTDEDAALAAYVRTHFDEVNALSGRILRIFVLERPERWRSAKRYWREHLEPELYRTLGALRWLLWRPYERHRSYEIARELGVPVSSLPCLVLFQNGRVGRKIVFPIESAESGWLRQLFGAIHEAAEGRDDGEALKEEVIFGHGSVHPAEPRSKPAPYEGATTRDWWVERIRRVEEWYDPDAATCRSIEQLGQLPHGDPFDRVHAAQQRIMKAVEPTGIDGSPQFNGYTVVIYDREAAVNENFNFYGQTTFINRPVDTVIRDFQNNYGSVPGRDQFSELLRLLLNSTELSDADKQSSAAIVHEIAADSNGADNQSRMRERLAELRELVTGAADIAAPAARIIESVQGLFQ